MIFNLKKRHAAISGHYGRNQLSDIILGGQDGLVNVLGVILGVAAALIVGVSALIGSLIPLAPFIFLSIGTGMYVSFLVSAVTLFLVGAIKAKMTIGGWGKSGIEMAFIGIVSALVGYGVGLLFRV